MQVLLLNEFFYPDKQGGTATATANIASVLHHGEGAKVSVITSCHAYRDAEVRYPAVEDWDGIVIHRVNSPNWLRKGTLWRLLGNFLMAAAVTRRALTMPRPDVVLVTTAPLTLPMAARALKLFRRVPYAYLIYDLDPDRTVALGQQAPSSLPVRLLRSVQERWLRGADRVVAIGRCMRSLLIERYGLDAGKVVVAEVGADPNVIRPVQGPTKFRKEQGLDGFVALYSGNFGQYHDFDGILNAADRLKGQDGITFVLVGGGHKKAEIAKAIEDRELTNVRLLPFVPEEELADLLASADVHLVTLEAGMEGLCVPSKFYSCLASGRPVVAIVPEATEVAMVLAESNAGWQVAPGDADRLVAVLREAAADPEATTCRGRSAADVFRAEYTTSITSRKIMAALRAAAGGS